MSPPETPLAILPMADEHLEAVLEIERQVFPDPWSPASFRNEIADRRVAVNRVAVDYAKGAVVGYFVSWFVEDEAHLGNLAVSPGEQQRGIGQLLLDGLVDEARRRRTRLITLEVRESNLAAQRLYLRNGFRPVAIRRRYYPDNREDAIVMQIDLARTLRTDDVPGGTTAPGGGPGAATGREE